MSSAVLRSRINSGGGGSGGPHPPAGLPTVICPGRRMPPSTMAASSCGRLQPAGIWSSSAGGSSRGAAAPPSRRTGAGPPGFSAAGPSGGQTGSARQPPPAAPGTGRSAGRRRTPAAADSPGPRRRRAHPPIHSDAPGPAPSRSRTSSPESWSPPPPPGRCQKGRGPPCPPGQVRRQSTPQGHGGHRRHAALLQLLPIGERLRHYQPAGAGLPQPSGGGQHPPPHHSLRCPGALCHRRPGHPQWNRLRISTVTLFCRIPPAGGVQVSTPIIKSLPPHPTGRERFLCFH